MDLFDKIDLFYRHAQDLAAKTTTAPSFNPAQTIKATAKSVLINLIQNPKVPMEEKKNPNSLGDYLRDFVGNRFSEEDLNSKWDQYLAALMNAFNMRIKNASSKEVGEIYKSLFGMLSSAWETVLNSEQFSEGGSVKNYVTKPVVAEWVGSAEDPWAKYNDPMSGMDMSKKMKENEEAVTTGIPLKTSRQDRLKKLAKLYKNSKV